MDDDGTLDGNLVIVGNGDPTINPRHPERWRAFDDWAAALHAKGIRIINGSLIGDDNAFAEPGWGVGWAWDNLQYGYGAPPSALQYNENQIEVIVGPGMRRRARDHQHRRRSDRARRRSPGDDDPCGGETQIEIARIPGTAHLRVPRSDRRGCQARHADGGGGQPDAVLSRRRCARRSDGTASSWPAAWPTSTSCPRRPTLDSAIELSSTIAAALEIIDVAMKWSRNVYAETLLLAIAQPGEPATGSSGLEQMRETLIAWGIVPESYLSRDGSGLSRYDYVTADALTLLTLSLESPGTRRAVSVHAPRRRRERLAGRPHEGHACRRPRAGENRLDVECPHVVRLRDDGRWRDARVLDAGEQLPRARRGDRCRHGTRR